jgi:uncharacterized RDD family membrane protein YckC
MPPAEESFCVICGEPITFRRLGETCRGCGKAIHNTCWPLPPAPGDNGKCRRCGRDLSVAAPPILTAAATAGHRDAITPQSVGRGESVAVGVDVRRLVGPVDRRMGVRFPRAAYAGLPRRCVILIIDLAVVALLGAVSAAATLAIFEGAALAVFVTTWLLLSYAYLVPLEASVGTLGLLLTQTKIVDLSGRPPSLGRMTLRLLLCAFWGVEPFLLIDLLWSVGNDCRQTIRDMFAGTYVVRKGAAPSGGGDVVIVYYFLFGVALRVPEVQQQRQVRAPAVA